MAQVSAEYDCPLFENRPYEALNAAITALNTAMSSTPECQQDRAMMETLRGNRDSIFNSVRNLQSFMQNPDFASQNAAAVEQNIQIAIQAASGLGQIFANSSGGRNTCSNQLKGSGKALVAISDILSNLAPYALMAVAVNPAIGGAMKLAITGGAVATSSLATIVQMIEQGTVDMTNPEHRKAILKNTCQFTKVARKVRYMQLAQSGQIQRITQELDQRVNTYQAYLNQEAPKLKDILELRSGLEAEFVTIERQNQKDHRDLQALEAQVEQFKGDPLTVCLIGKEAVTQSVLMTNDVPVEPSQTGFNLDQPDGRLFDSNLRAAFPLSIRVNLARSIAVTYRNLVVPNTPAQTPGWNTLPPDNGGGTAGGTLPAPAEPFSPSEPVTAPDPGKPTTSNEEPLELKTLKVGHDAARLRITAYGERALKLDDPTSAAAAQICASQTQNYLKILRTMVDRISIMVNSERTEVDTILSEKNPDYANWLEQARRMQSEKLTVSRVAKVMKELAKDNSVIDRSEMDQRMTMLKNALFGTRGSWNFSNSPIQEWIDHTLGLHENRVTSMLDNIQTMQKISYQMTKTGQFGVDLKKAPGVRDDEMMRDYKGSVLLENMTAERIPEKSRGHEIACQTLESAWVDWSNAINHLGATRFMCDMIDPYIDNKVERAIDSTCRGEIAFDGRQIKPSGLQKAMAELEKNRPNLGGLRLSDWALKIRHKMFELKCPMPPISVMN